GPMPRPVVPIALLPAAASRALSTAMWYGMISGVAGLILTRERTSTPFASSSATSLISASGESTTPLPIRHSASSRRMPEGIRCSTVFLPLMTRVWPALWPPWKRATALTRSVSRSTILPLPSSPHCAPRMTTDLPMMFSLKFEAPSQGREKITVSAPGCRELIRCRARHVAIPATRRSMLGRLRAPEVAQEFRVGLQDQHAAAVLERLLVGGEAAVEREEFRVLAVGLRVDRRGLRVALAAHLGGVALGVRAQHLALAVGIGLDLLRRFLAGVAQFVGQLQAFGAHALVHRFADLVRQVDALDAHVDHGDAEVLLRRGVGLLAHPLGDVLAAARDQVLQRARVELEAQRVLDDRGEPLLRLQLVAAGGSVVGRVVGDPPLHVEVDVDALLLGGEVALRLRVQRQDALVEMQHLLDHRQLEVQARRVVGTHDAAELQQQRALPLADHEHAVEAEQGQQHDGDDRDDPLHGWPPLAAAASLPEPAEAEVATAALPPVLTASRAFSPAGRLMMLRP